MNIVGVQMKAIDSEGTFEVFVETESSEDAGSLVQGTQALPDGFITNEVNNGIADVGLAGVSNTGVSEPEVSIEFIAPTEVSGMKMTAEFDLDPAYGDPDSAEFQGLVRQMESEILAALRDESSITMNIVGVQMKAIDSE